MPKTHGEGATHLTKPNPGRRTMDIPELARVLGIGTRQAYQAARRDELPVPTIRLGKRMVVSKDAVERLLLGSDNTKGRRPIS